MNGWDRFVADNLILMLYVLPFIGGVVFGWALREGKARLDQDWLRDDLDERIGRAVTRASTPRSGRR